MKNLLATALVLSLLVYITGGIKSSDPYVAVGELLGIISVALFNAHLTTKYLDLTLVKKYPLLAMLIVGMVSLFFVNGMLVFLVIVGSMALNKITKRNKK